MRGGRRGASRARVVGAASVLWLGMVGCTDHIGPEDPRYEDECIVYVRADASRPQIKSAIMEQLSGEQRARCRPPHVRRVSFG